MCQGVVSVWEIVRSGFSLGNANESPPATRECSQEKVGGGVALS